MIELKISYTNSTELQRQPLTLTAARGTLSAKQNQTRREIELWLWILPSIQPKTQHKFFCARMQIKITWTFSFPKHVCKMKISQENVKRAVRKASQCAIQEECVWNYCLTCEAPIYHLFGSYLFLKPEKTHSQFVQAIHLWAASPFPRCWDDVPWPLVTILVNIIHHWNTSPTNSCDHLRWPC